jgi:hypothetical protein
VHIKWHGLIQDSFNPQRKYVWTRERPQKEAAFLWFVYHNTVALSAWQNRFYPRTPDSCPCCNLGTPETRVYRFFDCVSAQFAWDFAFFVIYRAGAIPPAMESGRDSLGVNAFYTWGTPRPPATSSHLQPGKTHPKKIGSWLEWLEWLNVTRPPPSSHSSQLPIFLGCVFPGWKWLEVLVCPTY